MEATVDFGQVRTKLSLSPAFLNPRLSSVSERCLAASVVLVCLIFNVCLCVGQFEFFHTIFLIRDLTGSDVDKDILLEPYHNNELASLILDAAEYLKIFKQIKLQTAE